MDIEHLRNLLVIRVGERVDPPMIEHLCAELTAASAAAGRIRADVVGERPRGRAGVALERVMEESTEMLGLNGSQRCLLQGSIVNHFKPVIDDLIARLPPAHPSPQAMEHDLSEAAR